MAVAVCDRLAVEFTVHGLGRLIITQPVALFGIYGLSLLALLSAALLASGSRHAVLLALALPLAAFIYSFCARQ